jgi:alginate export protein
MRVLRVLSVHRTLAVAAAVGFTVAPLFAGRGDAACPASRPPYATLRYEEDYRFLRDPACRTDAWDAFKYVPLDRAGDIYLSTGVDARLKYEYFSNFLWGQGSQDGNGYVLQRYLVHGDVHVTPYARVFVQLESALEEGRRGGPRATDEDTLDLNQAFVDGVAPLGDGRSLTLRVGRQELSYGSQRVVSVRESPNVRQAFDALRLILTGPGARIDGFVSRPVDVHPSIEWHPADALTITLDADSFRRQSDRDGVYSPAGTLLRSGRRSRAMHVGEQVGIQAEWRVDAHLSLVASYTHFFAGRFIRETGPGMNIDYTTAWAQYRF